LLVIDVTPDSLSISGAADSHFAPVANRSCRIGEGKALSIIFFNRLKMSDDSFSERRGVITVNLINHKEA